MAKSTNEGFERWEKTTLNKTPSKASRRESSFKTTSHIEQKRLYTPLDACPPSLCGFNADSIKIMSGLATHPGTGIFYFLKRQVIFYGGQRSIPNMLTESFQ
jgi:hypothetical protein